MADDKPLTVTFNMDAKCKQCGAKGALDSGICMRCVGKNMRAGKYDGVFKKLRAELNNELKKQGRE